MARLADRLSFAIIGALGLALVAVLAGLVQAGPLDPPSSPNTATDSVRLPGTPITGPTVIITPGHYYLTRDIAVTGNNEAITISANDVSLDLGGFTISGDDTVGSAGIELSVGVQRTTISNGTVRDLGTGILANQGTHVRIHGVHAHSNQTGFWAGQATLIEDCSATSNTFRGIYVLSRDFLTVRSCEVLLNAGNGIELSTSSGSLIERSVIKFNNQDLDPVEAGIYVNGYRTTIRDNDVTFNYFADVRVGFGSDNVIINNGLDCLTSIVNLATNTYFPVNTTAPDTNRAHRGAC